jgi:hypothetical protein
VPLDLPRDSNQSTYVPERASWRDRERPHHVVVLVFDDVAVVHVGLRRGDTGREAESGPDGEEVAGVRLNGVLEAPLVRRRRLYRPGREGVGSMPPGTPCGPPYLARSAATLNGVRPTTWEVTRCRCIGWVSGVILM